MVFPAELRARRIVEGKPCDARKGNAGLKPMKRGYGKMGRKITYLVAVLTLGLHSFVGATNCYNGRQERVGTTWGCKAQITTYLNPDLHEAQGGVFSCAWVMVYTADQGCYAQVGYCKHKDYTGGKTWIFAYVTDKNGSGDWLWGNHVEPGSGGHYYECIQDANPMTGTKKWTFKYDGTAFANSGDLDTDWTGTIVAYMGETAGTFPNSYCQLVGYYNAGPPKVDQKVKFDNFRWLEPGNPPTWQQVTVNFWDNAIGYVNDREGDWGQEKSQANGYFKIWDTTP